jgi:hypothetical protein
MQRSARELHASPERVLDLLNRTTIMDLEYAFGDVLEAMRADDSISASCALENVLDLIHEGAAPATEKRTTDAQPR